MFRFLCCCGLVIVGADPLKRLVVRARTRVCIRACTSCVCNPADLVRILHIWHTYGRRNSAPAILNEIRDHRAFASRNEELVWTPSFPILSPRPFTRMSLVARRWIKSFLPDRNKCLLSDLNSGSSSRITGKLILVGRYNVNYISLFLLINFSRVENLFCLKYSKIYLISYAFLKTKKRLWRERNFSRQEIIGLANICRANAGICLQSCRSAALRKSIINIFMNASILVRSFLEGNVQFHRCTTVITENSTSANAPDPYRVSLFPPRMACTNEHLAPLDIPFSNAQPI